MSIPDFISRDLSRWEKERAELVKQLDTAVKQNDAARSQDVRLRLAAASERLRRLTQYVERREEMSRGLGPRL